MDAMSETRFPYCTLASFLVPLAYLGIALIASLFSTNGAGGLAYFDTPNAYRNLMAGAVMIGVWMVTGLFLNILSLVLRERLRPLAIIGILLYVVPAIFSLVMLGSALRR